MRGWAGGVTLRSRYHEVLPCCCHGAGVTTNKMCQRRSLEAIMAHHGTYTLPPPIRCLLHGRFLKSSRPCLCESIKEQSQEHPSTPLCHFLSTSFLRTFEPAAPAALHPTATSSATTPPTTSSEIHRPEVVGLRESAEWYRFFVGDVVRRPLLVKLGRGSW